MSETPEFRLFQAVRLRVDLPAAGLAKGTLGVVIDLCQDDPTTADVDFHVEDGSRWGRYVDVVVRKDQLDLIDE